MNNIFNMTARAVLSAAALACATAAQAQLHEAINVEGRYVPEIIRIDRVNAFPKAMRFSIDSQPIGYEGSGVAASFSPTLFTMPASGWRDSRLINDNPRYLELGAGSWLNSTLSAGYRFIDNSSTLFGVRLQHNSTSLWKPRLSVATEDVKQYRYDESLGLYLSHVFKGAGRLDAAFDYHLGIFNYFGVCDASNISKETFDVPAQTLNDVSFRLGWRSAVRPSSSLEYSASARMRYFGYRALHLPWFWNVPDAKGIRETNIAIAGGIRLPWDNGSSIGLDADLNVLAYGGDNLVFASDWPAGAAEQNIDRPDNYGMLTLTPFYRFTRGLLDIRLGADLDLAFNAGPDGHRYSFLHVAPDVKFALQTGQVGLFLNILGGSRLNTLASLHQYDYYMMPALTSTTPTYTPLDASLGVNLGPFSGFSLGIEARYRVSKNVPLGGWYQAWLDYGSASMPGMDKTETSAKGNVLYSLDSDGINLHGGSIAAKIAYEPSKSVSLSAEGSWQPQDGKKGYFNGYDRARVTARFQASVKPVDPLRITLGYDYRGVRRIYAGEGGKEWNSGVITSDTEKTFSSLRLPDLTLLNLSASWSFSESFLAWVQADNLLNRHDEVLPMQPSQGVVVLAGVKFIF